MMRRVVPLVQCPRAAPISRDEVRAALAAYPAERVEVAALLTDELVANAVQYGCPPLTLALDWDGATVTVGVSDGGRRPIPAPGGLEPTAEHGRGLKIVDALASAWGVAYETRGKKVWFRMPLA